MFAPGAQDGPGVWNAYVAAGETRAERRERLDRAPEALRAGIEAHVRTVFALRAKALEGRPAA